MIVLHDNVLVTEDKAEKTTEAGLILTADVTTGNKPARVIAVGPQVDTLIPGAKVYLKWSEAMPVELDGLKCAVVKYEHVKLVITE
jgi:co-chaperonin GroES (HSP10)